MAKVVKVSDVTLVTISLRGGRPAAEPAAVQPAGRRRYDRPPMKKHDCLTGRAKRSAVGSTAGPPAARRRDA